MTTLSDQNLLSISWPFSIIRSLHVPLRVLFDFANYMSIE